MCGFSNADKVGFEKIPISIVIMVEMLFFEQVYYTENKMTFSLHNKHFCGEFFDNFMGIVDRKYKRFEF